MKKIKKSQLISGSLSSLESGELQRASITPAEKVHGNLTGGGTSTQEVQWGSITGNINRQTDLKNKLDEKQHILTAGTNVTIDANNVISATAGEPEQYVKDASIEGNTLTLVRKVGDPVEFTGEPDEYLKNASVTDNTLTLTNKDGSTVTFTPRSSEGKVKDVLVDGTSVLDSEGNANIDLTGKQDIILTEKGIVKNNNTIGLTQTFYDYLEDVTYKKPTITVFNIKNAAGSNVNGTYESGSVIIVAKVEHSETNITSISGNLSFKEGSTVRTSIVPASSSTIITLDTPINVSNNTTFYLTGVDTRGGALSINKGIAFTRYAYVALTDSTTAPTTGTKKTDVNTFAVNGADITYSAGQYMYLYTLTSGKQVYTYVAGQWAPVTSVQQGPITFTQENGTTYTYYAYRVGPFSSSGTAKYRV